MNSSNTWIKCKRYGQFKISDDSPRMTNLSRKVILSIFSHKNWLELYFYRFVNYLIHYFSQKTKLWIIFYWIEETRLSSLKTNELMHNEMRFKRERRNNGLMEIKKNCILRFTVVVQSVECISHMEVSQKSYNLFDEVFKWIFIRTDVICLI